MQSPTQLQVCKMWEGYVDIYAQCCSTNCYFHLLHYSLLRDRQLDSTRDLDGSGITGHEDRGWRQAIVLQ